MKKRSGLIKNIIMVVASALTLVAVSFAWFTSNFKTNLNQYNVAIEGNPINVDFYQMGDDNKYAPLPGDIELTDFVPGEYNLYKFEITTKTADPLKLSFSIDGIPTDISPELKKHVTIKYSVYKLRKQTSASGNIAYVNSLQLAASKDFVSLSALQDGKIFTSLSLKDNQSASGDKFAIYYEIGLSEDAPASINGIKSSLGSVNVSAQRIG